MSRLMRERLKKLGKRRVMAKPSQECTDRIATAATAEEDRREDVNFIAKNSGSRGNVYRSRLKG